MREKVGPRLDPNMLLKQKDIDCQDRDCQYVHEKKGDTSDIRADWAEKNKFRGQKCGLEAQSSVEMAGSAADVSDFKEVTLGTQNGRGHR